MSVRTWMHDMLTALDTEGVPGLYPWLRDDVVYRFGSFPAGRGKESFNETWLAISSHIESLSHELLDTWETGDSAVCRGNVTYALSDGRSVTLPFANVFYLSDGKIAEYLIYVDASAVFGASSPE